MAENENKILKTADVFKETDDDGFTHVHIETPDDLKNDLAYLAEKMGINLEQLKRERRDKERRAKEAEAKAKELRHQRAEEAKEAKYDKTFLEGYGTNFLVTMGGKRIKKVKSFEDFVCPVCGVPLPQIRGWVHNLLEDFGLRSYALTDQPLCAIIGSPGRADEAKCRNKHTTNVLIQTIL